VKNSNDWRQSHRSITRRLTGVVLIPSVALLVMWTVVSALVVYNALSVRGVSVGVQQVSIPAVEVLSSARKERTLSLLQLARPGASRAQLEEQRRQTDRSLAAMQAAAEPLLDQSPEVIRQRIQTLNIVLGGLPDLRQRVDRGQADQDQTYAFYNSFVDAGSTLFATQARAVPDYVAGQGGLLATELFVVADRMSRGASLVSGGLATRNFPTADHVEFSRLVGTYHLSLETAAPGLPPHLQKRLREISQSDSWKRLSDFENQLIARGAWAGGSPGGDNENAGNVPPIRLEDWLNITNTVGDDLTDLAIQQAAYASSVGLQAGTDNLIRVVLGSTLALAAVIGAIVVAARVARRIARRLYRLRDDTLELADKRVPETVERLRNGEKVDILTEIPPLQYGSDEIGQVAHAFNRAVTSAVQESQAREGINNVFLGIAHRSQTLVHRQLKLLDKLERQGEDPDQMELLFQLDHLATRARRNAENLIILGGEQPGRKWSKPIMLVDILRSSVAETKHYARVRIDHIPRLSLTGSAVADMIHLIAELVDNATSFSPPHSQVTVQSQEVARGVVVEVEDHGLGMNEEDRDRANAMLSDPPEFDAMALKTDSRLGLFVIARLAAKHGIGVELRSSAYGGTRAIVLIPKSLIVMGSESSHADGRNEMTTEIPVTRAPAEIRTTADPGTAEEEKPRPGSRDANVGAGSSASSVDATVFAYWGETADEQATRNGNRPEPDGGSDTAATADADAPVSTRYGSDGGSWDRAEVGQRANHDSPQSNAVADAGTTASPTGQDWPRDEDWPATDADSTGSQPRDSDPRPPLPRRRRQASLAPQLRDEKLPSPVSEEDESSRSPEEIRGLMSAFQRGTQRARESSSGGSSEPDKSATRGDSE
jgi:signal transduction histidine kinase